MKKTKICLIFLILMLGFSTSARAMFHDFDVSSEQNNLDYFYMNQLSYGYQSSALHYNKGNMEFAVLGFRSAYIITNNTYQLSALKKIRLLEAGNLSFTGTIGLGALYSSSIGLSACGRGGGILGWDMIGGLKFAVPIIASIFSDGIMLDYSAGFSFKQFMLGVKGIAMAVSSANYMGLQNSFYSLAGVKIDL